VKDPATGALITAENLRVCAESAASLRLHARESLYSGIAGLFRCLPADFLAGCPGENPQRRWVLGKDGAAAGRSAHQRAKAFRLQRLIFSAQRAVGGSLFRGKNALLTCFRWFCLNPIDLRESDQKEKL